jgi:hypothetical protein
MRVQRWPALGAGRRVRPIQFVDGPDRPDTVTDDVGLGHDIGSDHHGRDNRNDNGNRLRHCERNRDANRRRYEFALIGWTQVVQSGVGSGD